MGIRGKASSSSTSSWSAAPHCAQLRAAYHDCFNRWYSEKFSKGQWEDKDECVTEWDKYRACLEQHLEDKHLRRLLVEAEAAFYLSEHDSRDKEGQ